MKPTLLCNGDSWVFGCEITDPKVDKKYGGPVKVYRGTYDYMEENDAYRIPRIWTSQIKKYLDCDTVNIAWPADDNKTILHRTLDYITRHYLAKNKSTKDLVVIVGWSSPERNSFWYKSENVDWHFRLWPNVKHFDDPPQEEIWKLYVKHLWNPEEYIPRYIINNLTLINFCENHKIKYLLYDSFYQVPNEHADKWDRPPMEKIIGRMKKYSYLTGYEEFNRQGNEVDWLSMWDLVKFPNFYNKGKSISTFNQFIKSKLDNPYIGLHPSPKAHDLWAQELARYLKKHIL